MDKIKNICLYIIIAIALYSGFKYVSANGYAFLYTHPDNQTSVYPYIAKVSKGINKILFASAESISTDQQKIKIVYTDAYGSGFIKGNIISSDLNYGTGIYLGKYEYDGTNAAQIAQLMQNTITLYQSNLYSYIRYYKTPFYSQTFLNQAILGTNRDVKTNAQIAQKSLKGVLSGKPYNIAVENRVFEMKPYEMILPGHKYIKVYTKDISYSNEYRKMLRELTVNIEFYAEIVDKTTGKTCPVSIVEETLNGRKLQTDFRYFVPHAYTDILSYGFVQKLMASMDDEEYFNTRLSDYFVHYQDPSEINGDGEISSVKTLKRLVQRTDLIAPILPKKVVDEIHKCADAALSSPTMAILDDYYTANVNLQNISKSSKLLDSLSKNGEIAVLIPVMETILMDMINDKNISLEEIKPLLVYQKMLNINKNNPKGLAQVVRGNSIEIEKYLNKLMSDKIEHKSRLVAYSMYFKKVLEQAGVHHIKMYGNSQHVYVLKDKFTKNINPKEFNKMNIVNGYNTKLYTDSTKFELQNSQDFYSNATEIENCWARYNPTKMEDMVWENIRIYLLKDKIQYYMRIAVGIIK